MYVSSNLELRLQISVLQSGLSSTHVSELAHVQKAG